MTEDHEPEVGIFFVVGDELFIESTPLGAAESYGEDFLIHPGDHASFWKRIIKLKESFSDISYDYYPRGRALFNVKKNRYWVYLDKCALRDPGMIAEIISEFHLPEDKTEIRQDSDYRCHNCNLHYVSDAIGLDIDDYLP